MADPIEPAIAQQEQVQELVKVKRQNTFVSSFRVNDFHFYFQVEEPEKVEQEPAKIAVQQEEESEPVKVDILPFPPKK